MQGELPEPRQFLRPTSEVVGVSPARFGDQLLAEWMTWPRTDQRPNEAAQAKNSSAAITGLPH